MIRVFWLIVKLAVIAAAAVWIAGLEGHVNVNFLYAETAGAPDQYASEIDIRAFLLAILALFTAIFLVYEIARFITRMPRELRRYNYIRRHEKGLQALTLGLTSVAVGDAKTASLQARRAQKFLPAESGLPLLLKAQAARLHGNESEAQENFQELLAHKDAGFLGLRGLLQASLESGDRTRALELARTAAMQYPKQGWILKTVYDLEIKARAWDEAIHTLNRAEKAGAMTTEKAISDRMAILMAEADVDQQTGEHKSAHTRTKKAFRMDPGFTPAAVQLAKFYIQAGKQRAAVKTIEESWTKNPHPELAKLWDALQPPHKTSDTLARLNWHEKLAGLNPNHPESHIMLAKIMMDQKFWGDARHHLKQAEDAGATDARTYRLRAELEDQTTRLDEFVMSWQEKADAALPEKTWVCHETGRTYDRWSPIAEPHGSFNTITWDHPFAKVSGTAYLSDLMKDTLIEPASIQRIKAARA